MDERFKPPFGPETLTTKLVYVLDSMDMNSSPKKISFVNRLEIINKLTNQDVIDILTIIVLTDGKDDKVVRQLIPAYEEIKDTVSFSKSSKPTITKFWHLIASYDPNFQPINPKFLFNKVKQSPDLTHYFIKNTSQEGRSNFIYRSIY